MGSHGLIDGQSRVYRWAVTGSELGRDGWPRGTQRMGRASAGRCVAQSGLVVAGCQRSLGGKLSRGCCEHSQYGFLRLANINPNVIHITQLLCNVLISSRWLKI